jgi:cytochrome P450
VLRGQHDYFVKAREEYGDIFYVDLGVTGFVALNHPRHVQHVLRDNSKNYRKSGDIWVAIRALIGNGLPASEGDLWLRQRRMMQPQFHRQRLGGLADSIVDAVDECLSRWDAAARTGEPLNVATEFSHITMRVIVKAMFGSGLSTEEEALVNEEMSRVLDYILQSLVTQLIPPWIPLPARTRYQVTCKRLHDLMLRIIERRIRGQGSGGSLLDLLIDMVDAETGEGMTKQQLRDEVMALFLAGYETTATTLSWVAHFLLQHPEAAQALRAEVDAALGGARPSFSSLPKLSYTHMFIRESLRLRPPVYAILRSAIEDDEIDGFHIPAGTFVPIMTYVIHRHPEVWERPNEFDPLRFLPEHQAKRPALSFLPFGAGQRQCIATDFAMMEGQLILARLVQRYDFLAVPNRTASIRAAMTLRAKDGVWVRLQRRAAHS